MAAPSASASQPVFAPADPKYRFGATVTPNDGVDLARVSDALHISVAGTLSVIMDGDTAQQDFPVVPAGVFKIAARRVRSTGTAATGIVALYY